MLYLWTFTTMLLLLTIGAVGFAFWRAKEHVTQYQNRIKGMELQVHTLHGALRHVNSQLSDLPERLKKVTVFHSDQGGAKQMNTEKAHLLLASGRELDEVKEKTGLSEAELQLMSRLELSSEGEGDPEYQAGSQSNTSSLEKLTTDIRDIASRSSTDDTVSTRSQSPTVSSVKNQFKTNRTSIVV